MSPISRIPDELAQRVQRQMEAYEGACGLPVGFYDLAGRPTLGKPCHTHCRICSLIQQSLTGRRKCAQFHDYAGRASAQMGEAHIDRCHAGLVVASAPLLEGEEYLGAFCLGPLILWEWDELAQDELMERLSWMELKRNLFKDVEKDLPEVDGKRMQALSETLYSVAAMLSGRESRWLSENRARQRQQMALADALIEQKRVDPPRLSGGVTAYPLHMEQQLLTKVRLGDRTGARGILNELMGHIFYTAAGNVEVMKARILELIIMISRAAVESGAELEKLLGMNYQFITQLSCQDNFEDICLWVVRVLETFMDTVYETRNVKGIRFLGDALDYLKGRYNRSVTLEEVAGHVHISPYYLSHLFKEELGMTFVEYLTQLRMDEARRLLTQTGRSIQEIAEQVGYDDPSYFCKVFKKSAGVTPNRFRKGI